ncbi:MAG: DEAD/DEAH box helicase [Bacilli bacterium]
MTRVKKYAELICNGLEVRIKSLTITKLKTPQTMCAAHYLIKDGKANKILVICPASLKYQWSDEIQKFLGRSSIVIDGKNAKQKEEVIQRFMNSDVNFAIVNYETVRTMQEVFSKLKIDCIIADEAHRLKNKDTQTYKAVAKIKAKYRMAASGTPMQNNVEEIYALFDWVQPGLLGKITDFRKKFMLYGERFGRRYVPIGPKNLGQLRKIISPYMLRRMKKDVAKELPPMIFHQRSVEMNKEQIKLYESITQDFRALLEELQEIESKGRYNEEGIWEEEKKKGEDQVLGYLYLMTAVSNHPELLRKGKGMSQRYIDLIPEETKSPKLEELYSMCEDLQRENVEKVVIFTQFTTMQEMIEQRLSKLGECALLNGSMSSAKRQEEINRFKNDPNCKFFVLTDAGNFGINLQFANTLINYDCPWNPATVQQRAGRVHRIGSTHEVVNIINLVTLETIDEKIQETLKQKERLGEAVVERNATEKNVINSLIKNISKKKKKAS